MVVCPGTYEPPSSSSPAPNQLGTLITGPRRYGETGRGDRSAAFQLWKKRVEPCGGGAEGSTMMGMVKMERVKVTAVLMGCVRWSCVETRS